MGRMRVFRQLTRERTDSLAAKSSLQSLVTLVKNHCEISWPEAELLGGTLYDFFVNRSVERSEGQIIYGAKWTPERHTRRTPALGEPIPVCLTVYHPYDVELWRETGGIRAVQVARVIRMTEEAYLQGGVLSLGDLALLTATSAKPIRETLKPMWAEGIKLPVMGILNQFSQQMRLSWGEIAMEQFLASEELDDIRTKLFISTSHWRCIYQAAKSEIMAGKGSYFDLWQKASDGQRKECLAAATEKTVLPMPKDFEELTQEMQDWFGMSKIGAHLLLEKVQQWMKPVVGEKRAAGQIVYHAVADYEPAGKPLNSCDLIPVTLDYLTEEDKQDFDQDAPKNLVWQRLLRLTNQARQQGASLNQPDVALIIGVSPESIQYLCQLNKDIFVPTRGNMADIGPGITHARKIIELYLQGYTETEIVQRAHHSYESVENYLDRFCKVVGLKEDGLTAAEIRIALGCSYNTVKEYLAMVEEFDIKEYRWMMVQIRARYQRKKTQNPEGGMPS